MTIGDRTGLYRSALILPVPETEGLVGALRARWDPAASLGDPAHITLLFPFLPVDRIVELEAARLQIWFAAIPVTDVSISRTGRFDGVVYLAPEPVEFFRSLTLGLWQMYPDAPPYGGQFETVTPHLTVVQADDPSVLDAADRDLARGLPLVSRAKEVWLIVEGGNGRWHVRERFPLGKVPS